MNNFEMGARRFKIIRESALTAAKKAEQEMARAALDAAKAAVPVRSGRLKGSLSAEGGTLSAGAPYAAQVESKTPFLRPSARQNAVLDAAKRAFLEGIR